MSFTAKEANLAIVDNNWTVEVEGEWKPEDLREAVQEECDFTIPGIPGKFKFSGSKRDVLEPDSYVFILEHTDGRFFGVFGYYDSWNGVEIEDAELVEVYEKEHTVKTWAEVKA